MTSAAFSRGQLPLGGLLVLSLVFATHDAVAQSRVAWRPDARRSSQVARTAPQADDERPVRRPSSADSSPDREEARQVAYEEPRPQTATRRVYRTSRDNDPEPPSWQKSPSARPNSYYKYDNVPVGYEAEAYYDESEMMEGDIAYEYDHFGEEHSACASCGSCGTNGCSLSHDYHALECEYCGHWGWLQEAAVFGGAHAFKGPLDQGQNGNFGFQEGVNFAGPLWHKMALGYQVGGQFVHSNFSGDNVVTTGTSGRDQTFITAGLFRRAVCETGWQYGAVFDWLDDNYYLDVTLAQLRTQVSYVGRFGHEVGFWGTFNVNNANDNTTNQTIQEYETTDIYSVFYRRCLRNGGEGRVWGGVTNNSDGLIGADFRVPLSNRWDLTGGFNYLIPEEGAGNSGGIAEESWGLTMNLVWYPGRNHNGCHNGPYRAMFNVADNNVMFIDRVMP